MGLEDENGLHKLNPRIKFECPVPAVTNVYTPTPIPSLKENTYHWAESRKHSQKNAPKIKGLKEKNLDIFGLATRAFQHLASNRVFVMTYYVEPTPNVCLSLIMSSL